MQVIQSKTSMMDIQDQTKETSKWIVMYVKFAVMCMILKRVTLTVGLLPGPSLKICLMTGLVRFAVPARTTSRRNKVEGLKRSELHHVQF